LPDAGEITALLGAMKHGDLAAESRLMALIYSELHARARHYMRRERQSHTLQPTALVNEAFLRVMREGGHDLQSRAHLVAAASIAMRRVLVDHARERAALKRPAGKKRVELNDLLAAEAPRLDQMLVLDEALEELARCDARQARVVELLYFGGSTAEEAGEALGISERTVKRDWRRARAWLHVQLAGGAS
jgi:RNA polymerase sigma-70 factor (ECF subfamily)